MSRPGLPNTGYMDRLHVSGVFLWMVLVGVLVSASAAGWLMHNLGKSIDTTQQAVNDGKQLQRETLATFERVQEKQRADYAAQQRATNEMWAEQIAHERDERRNVNERWQAAIERLSNTLERRHGEPVPSPSPPRSPDE